MKQVVLLNLKAIVAVTMTLNYYDRAPVAKLVATRAVDLKIVSLIPTSANIFSDVRQKVTKKSAIRLSPMG